MRSLSILFAAVTAASPVAFAQSTGSHADLGEVVVTIPPMSGPLTVVTDPRAAQQPIPASDGASFLENIPGFSVSRKGGADGDATFRGLGGSRLNIVLDGSYILGGCPHRMDPPTAYVYPESYDEVIVDKGPQSVAYGTGAAATVRFERRTKRFEAPGYRGNTALVAGSFGRNDQLLDLAGGGEHGFVRIIGTRSDADNYADGSGEEVQSAYTRWSGTAVAGWTPDADTRMELTMTRSDGEAAYADRAMDGTAFDRAGYALDFERSALSGNVDRVAVKLYHNNIDHKMDNFSLRNPTGMRRLMNPERTTSGGRIAVDLAIGDLDVASVGLDYQRNDHTSRMAMAMMGIPSVDGLARRDKASFEQLGAFGEYEHVLKPGTRLVAGLRVDRAKTEAEQIATKMDPDAYGGAAPGETDRDTSNSGFLRLERDLAAAPATLYAGFGRSERSPDFWERDRVFALDTEKLHQVDIGAGYRSGRLRVNAALFYARIDDFIQITNNGDSASNIDATTYGGEADLRYSLTSNWNLDATLSWVRGQNDTGDAPLAQIPPLEGSVAVNYRNGRYSGGILVRAVADQDRVDIGNGTIYGTDIGETEGFTIVSVNAGYRRPDGITLAAGIDNLLDETYAGHLGRGSADLGTITGRVNEPGRTLWLKLSADF